MHEIQFGNRQWWTDNTMSYDWNLAVNEEKFSDKWFTEIDQRFIHGTRLFAHGDNPFDRIIPFDELAGKKVLEIGCGMGMHSELLVRAGAVLTAIDLSDTSVMATRKRLQIRNLKAEVLQMDAEELDFPDESFDFVWSWGVIHHSSHTSLILKHIARVLKQNGELRIMVYNLNGMPVYLTLLRDYFTGFWYGANLDETLWRNTDGYMARYYTADMLADVMNLFYSDIDICTYGQDADAVPLPRFLRRLLLRFISQHRIAEIANKRGGFLFAKGRKR